MITFTITGNVGRDPEVRVTKDGLTYCRFSVAHTPRRKREDGEWEDAGETVWAAVTVFGSKGEAAAESLSKGDKVHVVARRVSVRGYVTKDPAQPGASLDVIADDVFSAIRAPGNRRHDERQPVADSWNGEPPF